MRISTESSKTGGNAVLISVHPEYTNKMLSGEKRVEFRRRWTKLETRTIVIYSTAPVGRIVAIASVAKTISGSPTKLWEFSRALGAGIARQKLFDYLKGTKVATAIELSAVHEFVGSIEASEVFGNGFRPPQSFRYLMPEEMNRLNRYKQAKRWVSPATTHDAPI